MKRRNATGQGVVEYSGAIIVATVLVAVALTTGTSGLSNLFINIVDTVQNVLMDHLGSL